MSQVLSITTSTALWAESRQLDLVQSEETGSTNDDAKKNAFNESSDFVLYLTAHQTAGRGRGTNTWLDTGNGESLLSTWSIQVPSSPQAIAAPRIGLGVLHAVHSVWPSLQWSIKAPNDIFLDGQKVAGLLVESVTAGDQHRLLVGLGFNVLNHPRRFTKADHLGAMLSGVPGEGDWFQFLDELSAQLKTASQDCLRPTLSDVNCNSLAQALNANPNKPFTVTKVSPQGDIFHAGGQQSWTEI